MPKIGRNDPCPCGSGKKYKHCHLPIEEAAQAEQLRMRRAVDTLLPKVIDAARSRAADVPDAFARFWNAKYSPDQLAKLDDLEGRGAERFLTWFAFDYPLDGGRTLVEDLAAGGADKAYDTALELSDEEAQLLGGWTNVRLQPYVVEGVRKGQGMHLTNLVEGTPFEVEDHAASRRVDLGEVLVAHLLPAGDYYYIGGAAAHLTADTREKMREFLGLHLEAFQRDHTDATWSNLLRAQSEVLNHFVMQLPVEEPNPTLLDNIIAQTRISLKLAGESLGIGKRDEE
jgi:SEC-C motif